MSLDHKQINDAIEKRIEYLVGRIFEAYWLERARGKPDAQFNFLRDLRDISRAQDAASKLINGLPRRRATKSARKRAKK